MTAQSERAAIVAWLREQQQAWRGQTARYRGKGNYGPYLGGPNGDSYAGRIERGDHLQEQTNAK